MGFTPTLDLDQCPEMAVFRKIDSLLAGDKTLRSVLKSYRSWQGAPVDKAPLGIDQAPALRITPDGSDEKLAFPAALKGTLFINCELVVRSIIPDDLYNLWHAVRMAIYGPNRVANLTALQVLGARNQPLFVSPRITTLDVGQGWIEAMAQIYVDVDIKINP